MHLACGRLDTDYRKITFKNTHVSFEEALAAVPKAMISVAPPSGRKIAWNEVKPSEEIDWNEYLSKLKADKP